MSLNSEVIREKALALGWDDVGIAPAKIPEEEIDAYRSWLSKGYHGELAYMENQIRCRPQELLPGAQSAIIFVTYYKGEQLPFRSDAGLVASYARGRDYHNVHRRRLKHFIRWMEEVTGKEEIARGFSDSKPILERALAVQAGLGWLGKNTLLIHRRFGTFTLLSGVLTTLELPLTAENPQSRFPRCGVCTRCLDACPTKALIQPYTLDARKCLSYHLIESKKPIPKEIAEKNPGYIFGCDICQDVCPHNVRKPISTTPEFAPEEGVGPYLTIDDITSIEAAPESLHGTPLKRRGAKGLKLTGNTLFS